MQTMAPSDCVNGTIAPLNASLTGQQVQHLFRRIGFGIHYKQIEEYVGRNSNQVVNELLQQAVNQELNEPPTWLDWDIEAFENADVYPYEELTITWMMDMLSKGFRDKLTLFWSNHFVTEVDGYFEIPNFMYRYLDTLQRNALGNFKDFVLEIGLTGAMLLYLDGARNIAKDPNENYARELFELFTLGENNNYTEEDIREAARALTGWTLDPDEESYEPFFVNWRHDKTEKTIFGQTGNWGYEEVIDLLFTYRRTEMATHICRKIYQEFVSETVDESIVEALAKTFEESNFELLPVFKQLFQSSHFFDASFVGTRVKPPTEFLLNFSKELGAPITEAFEDEEGEEFTFIHFFPWLSGEMGQFLLSPPNVAGWKGHNSWIDSSKISYRWSIVEWVIWFMYENLPDSLVEMARTLSDDSKSPDAVCAALMNYFTPQGIYDLVHFEAAVKAFRTDFIPDYYYDNEIWSLDWEDAPFQVTLLLLHLVRQPEFQLC